MAKFDNTVIADPDLYCRGGFFVVVDGGQSTPVQFVAGAQQIKAAGRPESLLLAIVLHCCHGFHLYLLSLHLITPRSSASLSNVAV